MKKKLFSLAVVVICLSLLVGSTWAYFTAEGTAHNVITSGSIGIEIIEKTLDGNTKVDFPEEGIKNIMPGSVVSKIVSVANVGQGDAWIRVKVDTTILSADNQPLPLELDGKDGRIPVITFTVEDGWTKGSDGYYYYNTPVSPTDEPRLFFNDVTFALEMGNAYQNSTAKVSICAEAVQSANNAAPNGDVTAIQGWPEVNKEANAT